jgi:hypothetical protein
MPFLKPDLARIETFYFRLFQPRFLEIWKVDSEKEGAGYGGLGFFRPVFKILLKFLISFGESGVNVQERPVH